MWFPSRCDDSNSRLEKMVLFGACGFPCFPSTEVQEAVLCFDSEFPLIIALKEYYAGGSVSADADPVIAPVK